MARDCCQITPFYFANAAVGDVGGGNSTHHAIVCNRQVDRLPRTLESPLYG